MEAEADDETQRTPSVPSLFAQAEERTEKVAARIEAELAKWPLIHWMTEHFSGLVYWAAQRLLDKQEQTKEHNPRDHAIIVSCPRLFSDCLAGYHLARKGLILQSAVVLRSAFENTMQMILFLEQEEMAQRWLDGKQIRPKDVRELTDMPDMERTLYKKLSDLAHPNHDALRLASAPVPGPGTLGRASFYGGWFAPKQAGQMAIQFLWAQLVFLEKFYATYSDELREHGLLWRQETLAMAGKEPPADFTWLTYLAGMRDILTRLTTEHDEQTAEDILEIAMEMSTYTPEEKEIWRKGFEERLAETRAGRDQASGVTDRET